MLGSMGIKGRVLYHISYGTTLGFLAIDGVISCCQPKCWLTVVGWITKFGCDWICGTGTLTCTIGVFVVIGGREVLNSFLINWFSLSSTKG